MINGQDQATIAPPSERAIDGPSTVANNELNEDCTGAQASEVPQEDNLCSRSTPPSSMPMQENTERDEPCVSGGLTGSGPFISDNVSDGCHAGGKPVNDATIYSPWDSGFQGLTAYDQAMQKLYTKYGAECDE